MIRNALLAPALGAVMLLVGCASKPQFETRSYPLQRRATEEPLIKATLSDESVSFGPDTVAAIVTGYGDKVTIVTVTPDNVAVVRATRHGHDAIRKALKDSRRDAATRPGT